MKLEIITQTRSTGKTSDLLDKVMFDYRKNRKIFVLNHSINSTKNFINVLKAKGVEATALDKELRGLRGLSSDISIFMDEPYLLEQKEFQKLIRDIEVFDTHTKNNVYIYCTGTPELSLADFLFNF
jgi:hypothetical protein